MLEPTPIEPIFRAELSRVIQSQYLKGLSTYGHELTEPTKTPNQEAYSSALEELVDLGRYLTQLKLERDRLKQTVQNQYKIIKYLLEQVTYE